MKQRIVQVLVPLAMSAAAALPLHADRLVTHDGRVLEVKQAREGPDDTYILTFESGEIVCPARFIASIEIEGDMSDYVPKSDDEKKKLDTVTWPSSSLHCTSLPLRSVSVKPVIQGESASTGIR